MDRDSVTKTTVNLPAAVLTEARRVAEREGTTLKEIFLSGLRSELARRREPEKMVHYEPVTFGGSGLQPGVRGLEMHRIVTLSYGSERGGEEIGASGRVAGEGPVD